MSEPDDDKARKAAEEWVRKESANLDINSQCITDEDVENLPIEDRHIYWAAVRGVLQGVAWARATPGWIKCSERMPEHYRDVAVLVGQRQIPKIGEYDSACGDWNIADIGSIGIASVTHWMPLPPAPEGE
jgi:hypothetical protein